MKKIFTTRPLLHLIAVLSLCACAFTEYGNRINDEQLAIARLEDKRHNLETQYIILLNSLELHPTEEKLMKQRDAVREKLQNLAWDLEQKRKGLDQSFKEWEQKVLQERIEREMIDKEVKDNQSKDEDVDFNNK